MIISHICLPITSLILGRYDNLHVKTNLELNSLFYFKQSGFRKHHSCQTVLIKTIHDWLSAINQNKIAGSLFLDFSKAFDLVDHSLLIRKLKLYKIDTSWFSSYLNKRYSTCQLTHRLLLVLDYRLHI